MYVKTSPLKEALRWFSSTIGRARPHLWIAIVREMNLLFVTWRIDPAILRPLVPPQLELDLYDGAAWITIEALDAGTAKFRLLPPPTVPKEGIQANVRTYVRCAGEPGIFMLSMDCPGGLMTPLRRALFLMPFYTSTARLTVNGDYYHVESFRTGRHDAGAQFAASGRIEGPPVKPQPGTIDAFLMTRILVFAVEQEKGIVYRGLINHRPRITNAVNVVIEANTMLAALGLEVPPSPPLFHYSQGDDALGWPFSRVTLGAAAPQAPPAAV